MQLALHMLFLQLGCLGGGIIMSIAQYVSYGSLVLFVGWGTELYATIASLCHIASRMAGCLYDEWMYGSPLAAGGGVFPDPCRVFL